MPVGQPALETVTNTYIYIYMIIARDRDRQTVTETCVLTTRADGTGGRQGVGQVADRTVYGLLDGQTRRKAPAWSSGLT